MWISRQLSQNGSAQSGIESGRSVSSGDEGVNVVSTGAEKDVVLFSPFGYSFSLPSGESVLSARNASAQAIIGIEMSGKGLRQGEIKITAASGAYIHLRDDGSVVINGLEINKNGVIE